MISGSPASSFDQIIYAVIATNTGGSTYCPLAISATEPIPNIRYANEQYFLSLFDSIVIAAPAVIIPYETISIVPLLPLGLTMSQSGFFFFFIIQLFLPKKIFFKTHNIFYVILCHHKSILIIL